MPRSILLYNHISGTGHHESWTAMFAALLLERGYRVVIMTPVPAVMLSVLENHDLTASESLIVLLMPETLPLPPSFRQRLKNRLLRQRRIANGQASSPNTEEDVVETRDSFFHRWYYRGHMYAHHLPEVRVTFDLPWRVILKRSLLHVFAPPMWYLQKGISKLVRSFFPAMHYTGERYPGNLSAAANAAQSMLQWKPDVLLSMYADVWITKPSLWRPPHVRMSIPWGGVRFAPLTGNQAGTEGYFSDPMFKGLCFLDEAAVESYRARQKRNIFAFLPDIVNGDLPEEEGQITREMVCKAKGRPIVLLCGSIEGRKNLLKFYEMATSPEASDYLFAIVGQVHTHSFCPEEQKILETLSDNNVDNIFFRDIYFKDEREMNEVIATSDVIFAVYRNFPISSNMLGKAAHFYKPILVSNRSLMGRRVREYGIGCPVSEDDAPAMLHGLQNVLDHPIAAHFFEHYNKQFCKAELGNNLDVFLQQCVEG